MMVYIHLKQDKKYLRAHHFQHLFGSKVITERYISNSIIFKCYSKSGLNPWNVVYGGDLFRKRVVDIFNAVMRRTRQKDQMGPKEK